MNQPASNVTLKHPTGPWWTIYGSAGEIVQQIAQVFPHLATNQATDFPAVVAQASAEWATLVSATSQTPGANPGGQTFQGQGNGGFNGNQGGGGFGGGNTGGGQQSGRYVEEHPKGWGTFEHGHPEAPNTIHGPKVLKRWRSQAGKDLTAWLDPRDPAIPSVYAVNKDKPADLLEIEWAKGV